MRPSDWIIIAAVALLMLAAVINGIRNRASFVDVWAFALVSGFLAFTVNRSLAPYGVVVFLVVPALSVVVYLVSRLRSGRAA